MKVKLLRKEYEIFAPWEKTFDKVVTPFENFIHNQTTTGLILLLMTIVALIFANSPFSEAYEHFFHTHFSIQFGNLGIDHSIHHWINDGLMAIFFFLVGLEIKREVLVGELSDPKNAALPIIAAIGGMVFPALIFYSITQGTPAENGWGIPMATDIAFAISALVILGKRVPAALVTFLVALAIVDDLGAVTVIALFYTDQIHLNYLLVAFAFFGVLIVFNRVGIHKPLPYFIIGGFMWAAMLESGVHATIAGILTALTIPARPKFNPRFFHEHIDKLVHDYHQADRNTPNYQLTDEQKSILHQMECGVHRVQAPLNRLEHNLHLPVALIIIPLFALANAGIALNLGQMSDLLVQPVTLGVMFGLVLGKVIGIAGVSWLAIKLKLAKLPTGASMSQLFGVSFLGGIGFTMSIFIADLAWEPGESMLLEAKTGILIASLIAGLFGYIWLRFIAKNAANAAD
ncbi:Na+/H+ antiporter NhaA [Thiomicrorhabdus heinhorstiae]|uniref:Na(+)/H(+) antiporter NhaA n=1 Tax=Thiomicrorhabdus heinhorstiae TaxID=2748010 RepID=A0ABS0BZ93_9GAMM|nr:Na+/H+ antiporter NhaA [Thiomicrorhabdus heinhorstiae]MBF6059107.1 Na+/H+ antiporter NhaA [Thiomicrorhabdus heinhorstiae]